MAERCTRAVPYSALAAGTMSSLGSIRFCLWKASSVLSSAFVYEGQSISQRSGAPGQPSGGRAGGGKQPQFTCGVKRNRLRASPAVRTVCPAQTGSRVTRAKVSPPGAFRLPGREGRAGGIHFRRKQGPKRASPAVRTVCPEQTGFCAARAKAMSQVEFTSAVSKARSVQAPQPVQRVQRRRAFVLRGRRRKGAKA